MARAKSRAALPPWSMWHHGDYAKDTSHLSGELHGALMNLLRIYLASTGPLPNDEEAIFERASVKTEAMKADTRAALRAYFWLGEDGRLHNELADDWIAKAAKNSTVQSERAKEGMQGRERDERGRIKPKVPRNHPAVAGENPAVAGIKPAVASESPAVAGDKPTVVGFGPAILEPDPTSEINSYIPKEHLSISPSLEKGNVPKNTPAPPKGAEAGKVGADRSTSSPPVPQVTDNGPPPSAEQSPEAAKLVFVDLLGEEIDARRRPEMERELLPEHEERRRRMEANDPDFAKLPLWLQQGFAAASGPYDDAGPFVLTPEERASLEHQRVTRLFNFDVIEHETVCGCMA